MSKLIMLRVTETGISRPNMVHLRGSEEALEFLRKIREEAWDEGHKAGYMECMNGKKKKNPYRKKEKKS